MIEAIAKKAFGLIPWWLWPLALSVSIGAGFAAYQMTRADLAQAQAALSDLQRETAQATTRASEFAREKETMLLATTVALSDKLNKEKSRAQETQNRLVSDLRSGAQRLSIAARCQPSSEPTPDAPAAPGSGATGARADLDPATAEALISIAADGDTAIRERNACIDAYNSARETLND